MRYTSFFLKTLKDNPVDAQIVSHQLMMRTTMVRQLASGLYVWLPMGKRVLTKIENLVRHFQDEAGAQEVLMPTLQPADLWKESGRYEAYGEEMLRMTDRHDRELVYGPTNEEVITRIFGDVIQSYKDLPKNLYHIQWKFRDEIRPRFGVMRGREFLMKDAYSFDIDEDSARKSYKIMFEAYMKTFQAMGLKAIPVRADTGAIGGDLSHEFQIVADTGESTLYYDKAIDKLTDTSFEAYENLYAAADEMHTPGRVPGDQLSESRGIEVGHIFYFGKKYTESMGVSVMGPDGKPFHPEMGSYGIGVSRLVGALIEACHDEQGICWPEAVAPFDVGLANLKVGDDACDQMGEDLYAKLKSMGLDVLYDDRTDGAGAKLKDMDLIGLPWQLRFGPKSLKNNEVEVKYRPTGEVKVLSPEAALTYIKENKRAVL
jgi:prolyl-tRNA synthetase